MPIIPDEFLSGANIDFIEGLYARFLEDPNAVDPSWRELFEQQSGGRPIYTEESGQPAALRQTPVTSNGNGNGHHKTNGNGNGNGNSGFQHVQLSQPVDGQMGV